jgi:hypothetical protein
MQDGSGVAAAPSTLTRTSSIRPAVEEVEADVKKGSNRPLATHAHLLGGATHRMCLPTVGLREAGVEKRPRAVPPLLLS